MRNMKVIVNVVLALSSIAALAQESARTVQYHSQDIIAIRAKVKYTTLIELPTTEKIMEAATGDKDFWIVDVVGNFCFVHPAKQGISSNLNLITDKGNIYSFTLQDISGSPGEPDLKVIVEPADRSAIVAASGPAQFLILVFHAGNVVEARHPVVVAVILARRRLNLSSGSGCQTGVSIKRATVRREQRRKDRVGERIEDRRIQQRRADSRERPSQRLQLGQVTQLAHLLESVRLAGAQAGCRVETIALCSHTDRFCIAQQVDHRRRIQLLAFIRGEKEEPVLYNRATKCAPRD